MNFWEQLVAAYIEKQAPEQAPLILAGIQLAVPALVDAHTQAAPPKSVTITFDPATGTHAVTTEFHPEPLLNPEPLPAPAQDLTHSNPLFNG